MKKKIMSVLLALACTTVVLAGCSSQGGSSSKAEGGNKKIKIGVIQLVQHEALDQAYQGFVDGLKEAGYIDGENIEIDLNNAGGDQSNCPTIANKLVKGKSDLILAIATPAAQAVANATTDIPLLVTAVTDPAASGLVKDNEKPGVNVSGTSDLTPVKEQLELLKKVVPEAKKVGILYCSSEDNSKIQVDLAKEAAKDLDLELVEASVSNSNEVQQVTQSLMGKVDVLYTPTDNMISENLMTVNQVAQPNKIPIIGGEPAMVGRGALLSSGVSYYNLGKQTAAQAVKILKDEEKIEELPIEYAKELENKFDEEIGKDLGIEMPEGFQGL